MTGGLARLAPALLSVTINPSPSRSRGGSTVNVPLFIKEGEWVKIDTRTGAYLERVNK
jgi:Elongation factor P, C-terminal